MVLFIINLSGIALDIWFKRDNVGLTVVAFIAWIIAQLKANFPIIMSAYCDYFNRSLTQNKIFINLMWLIDVQAMTIVLCLEMFPDTTKL